MVLTADSLWPHTPWAGARADRMMVAGGNPLAVQAALDVLSEGGSAIDAAIAADAIMGVVEPMATGVGGDLLAMIVEPDGTPRSYNGTGRAPGDWRDTLLASLPGGRIPERHPLSVTVPGAVRGWSDLHRRYGRLPWPRLLAPAIALAGLGFAVASVAAREWALFAPVIARDPASARLYRAARTPRAGERFANPALAATLSSIAEDGPDFFYRGSPASQAAQSVQQLGGILQAADFAAHTGDFTTPLQGRFRDLTILECPPNSHGIAVLDALAAIDPLSLDRDDPRTMVAVIRATAAALDNARRTVADPSGNTVCTVVVDETGLACTLMTSVFKRFGSGIGVADAGFVLQNRGFGFATPGHVNAPAPGKRPYHTVVPGAALRNGRFHAAFGVVGGLMQPQGHIQLMLRLAAWHEPLQPALDAPRWRLESADVVATEAGMPAAVEAAIRGAGYTAPTGEGELGGRSDFGGAQIVMRDAQGGLMGGSDRRKDGMAAGY